MEKTIEKDKEAYMMAFVDLEKAYNNVSREKLWMVLEEYGVEGNLLRAIQVLRIGQKHYMCEGCMVRVNRRCFMCTKVVRWGCYPLGYLMLYRPATTNWHSLTLHCHCRQKVQHLLGQRTKTHMPLQSSAS